jgi:uncharacterized Zn-binding protein involved in type VI secretion
MVGDDVADAEAVEVAPDAGGIVPLRGAADGLENAVRDDRVGGIDEVQVASAVVLQSQREADDGEAEIRADDDVARPQCADQCVIEIAEAEVEVRGRIVVPEGLRSADDVLDELGG